MTPKLEREQREILESQDSFMAYMFACSVPGADIEGLQAIVLKASGFDAYRFARDVEGADVQALQAVVLERGDSDDAYRFARDVKNADRIPLLERAIFSGIGPALGGRQRDEAFQLLDKARAMESEDNFLANEPGRTQAVQPRRGFL